MTKDQYIESLVAQGGLSSKEMYAMTKEWEAKNKPQEKVKSNDPAVEAETNVGSENNTVSDSESGSSEPLIMPDTVVTKGDKDFKFTIDPETNQPVYYSKPAGDDDARWTVADKEDDRGLLEKASIAYHFGHSDMSEEKVKEYEDHFKAQEEFKKKKKEALKQYAKDEELGWTGMITGGDGWFNPFSKADWSEARWGEAISRFAGEGVELAIDAIDLATDSLVDVTLEPMAAALNTMGIMDFSDYEDDSFVGINFDNIINDTVAEFVIGDAAYTGQKDALGREKGKYDFGEEVGDLVESGVLSIGAAMMATPQLLADTKKMIGDTLGITLPPGAQEILNNPIMRASFPGLTTLNDLTQKDLVEKGEEAYNVFSKKAELLNMTLADFGDVGMAEMMGDAFTGGDEGDWDMKKRIGSFVAGSTRITASALGSLPSVAQSMIPYVGIASIVVGEAARTNMESKQDGRPLDWARLGHAYTTGASEGLLELVTKKIGMGMFKGLSGASKEVVEQTLKQYGVKVMKEFGQEGLSEVGTLLINQVADAVYKDEVTEYFPKFGELIDTFLIGGVMGGGMSATGVGGQLIRNTISRKNIKGNLKTAGYTKLSNMFESINPLTEGGLSQEIGSGMEDSTSKRQRLEDTKRIKQVDDIKKKPSKSEIQQTSQVAQQDAMENAVRENTADNIKEQNVVETVSLKDGKPVAELTVDEKADAAYDVLTNPSTEMFLNTELKREVEAGTMTTTKADEIKANFKAQQGAANRMQGLGYTGQQRQQAIGLLAEKENLQKKIDEGDKALTKTEQARVEEINNELSSIPRSAEQQANIDKQVEKDIEFTEKFGNVGKKDGEFENAVGENKAVQVFETTQEFEQLAKDNNINVDETVDGFVLPNGQIFLNKQKMREAGAIGVGRHELLHKILKQQFSGPNGEKLKNEFLKILQETDPQGYALLMDKMKLYSEQELKDAPDEYLANYASLLIEGAIPLETFETKPSLIERLSNFFSSIFADAANENPVGPNVKPSDIGFKSGQDLYDFVKGYVKDSESGVLSDRAQQLAEKGGETTGEIAKKANLRKDSKSEVSLTPYMGVGNRFKQGETEDGETPAQTRKKSEKNFKEFQKSAYNRDSEAVLENQDAAGPLDGIVALDKQLADLVRKSGEQSVYSWYWQNDGNNNHQEIYEEIERRKEKVKQLETQYSADELRAQLKDAKGKNREDIKLAIQEKFKKLPAAVRDAEIDIYTGKPITKVKKSRTKVEPLDAINDLIPSNIKTKKQFEDFMRSPRPALKIAQALDPGGVIHNYIRSRETSKEQGDKMLDEVRLRMFNFDPEAVRADGTVVGPKGFGESIFANTRFAKMVANKDLAKEGETRKSTKSIDSEGFVEPTTGKDKSKKDTKPKEKRKSQLPRSTTKFTTNFASNLGINVEGKTPKQLQEEIQKQFDKAIAKDLKANPVKTFGETRNIGQAVAALMEKATGMPAKVFTDKSQNIQKKDADSGALTAVKQYLYNNAQRDFNNLPDASDTATGKANFIPENIKRAFYKKDSKGKFILDKSKGLKDYQNLLGDMDKPVYRASEAQTIKGLVGLSLRNRIFEQAMPDPIARKTTGVKFAKSKIDNNSLLNTLTQSGINTMMKSINESYTTINKGNRKAFQTKIENSIKESGMPLKMFDFLKMGHFGRKRVYGDNNKKYKTKDQAKAAGIKKPKTYFEKQDGTYVEKGKPGSNPKDSDQWVAAVGNPYYGETDPAYKEAKRLAQLNDSKYPKDKLYNINETRRIEIPFVKDKNGKQIPRKLTLQEKADNKIQEEINMDALMDFIDLLNKKKDGKLVIPLEVAGMFVAQSYQATTGLMKIAAPFVGVSERFIRVKPSVINPSTGKPVKQAQRKESFIEEHSPPVNVIGAAILWGLKNGGLGRIKQGIKDNFIQVQLSNSADLKLDRAKLDANLPAGVSILTPNAGIIRLAAAGINTNTILDLNTGKSLADKAGLPLPQELRSNLSAVNYQNRLLVDASALQSDPKNEAKFLDKPIMTLEKAKGNLKESRPVQKLKQAAVDKGVNDFGDQIFSRNQDAQQRKDTMLNSFETRINASRSNPKRKGISVFDFDDTLARTKEKVIVNMIDGTTKEISAAEFAKQAGALTAQGAEFDFSNFENVAKGTKEGPLADLARKRQGKFGSGDIFVLTARPNSAGPAIQAFLKNIGIDIPLQNITGLSDGTAQAKADWVLNKTAEGYNDFYFADDSFANVAGVKAVLDAVDVKNKVQQAKFSKSKKLNTEINKILEEVTGTKAFKKYSTVRARLEGKKKDGGLFKRFLRQFTITPSADDFAGLTYAFRGVGEQGNRHAKWIEDNLIKPYDKAELELMSAKISVANDFAALKKQFPNLKTKRNTLGWKRNPLLAEIGVGPFTKSQAVRVYMWHKQGMDIPGMSKRDIADLVKAVEGDNELNVFADEVMLIQKDGKYPPPQNNWMAGDMKSDILNGLDKGFRQKLLTEWNENIEAVFTPELYNKLEALYGSKYIEALKDSIRRMRSGSNRPVYTGGGSRIVNDMLDWLNASVGATMFINQKSGLLQTLSTVNFINWGDNNIYAAAKAFAGPDFYPTFMRLMNSDYLVNRRDGLKINVNEAELVDAGKKGGFQGMVSYLLDKGFVLTRIMDSLAIATGGATFFINRKAALLKRTNPETGKLYTEAEADKQAFEDFYAIAEETQQSSNPSKISQQQASLAGRVLLSFQNVTMQFNRKTKKSILDFVKRRRKPGMTQRESDMSNLSSVMYYVGMQNLIFHSLQQALFAGLFDEDEEEDKNQTAEVANSMLDSLLFGLGFGGAIISTVKNVSMRMYNESQKKSPDYEDPLWDIFDVSPVLDSKVRKLRQAAKSFSWNMKEIKRRGWSLDNPAYLAISQIVSAFLNLPADRVMNIANNMRNAMDEETRMWQKIALTLGWSPYILGLPYWGRQSTIDQEAKEDAKLKENYKKQVERVKKKGFTKKIPLSGPNHYKPEGQSGVDFMQVERPDGTIQYYVKP